MADTCGQVILGSGLTVLSHPLMYIKVLIQVGHEPLPPTLGHFFRREVYHLPGFFAYAKHIIKIDGKAGLFKGLAPRLCAGTIGTVVHSKIVQKCHKQGTLEILGGQQKSVDGALQHVVNETNKEMIARSFATIITHPFHVITLRCMVQFIGRETKYSGVLDSIITIYREEGMLGFFAGLIPRLLGDIFALWICNLLAHFINTYAIDDSMSHTGEIKNCSQAMTGFLASMLTYPFVLVSNIMAVNNCGLTGGRPPYASIYPTWVHCWKHLSREGNMSRGSSLFFRRLPAGKTYAIDQKIFY
ncbi:mitochondrial carrier homolog 2-like isoform X2 [Corythoichthys intestinalis]|uniref:mitochondrial carrier homolog 2-like isoform X2 n=1 Tax=Corythoichthys intestinalis TaxID=161448 RepID=UPI0025A5E277|nr:mitochondrial carrier homolog 2-like isoform X2 [Corythoichthys intestinalis]XP_061811840.1 mitochondrial carrier homolog 2-like [Nerophis lumbriciformis]